MEFQKILLKVAKALSREETEALAFLCRDLNQRKAESPMDLFKHLMDKGFLSEDEPELLVDLLDVIGRQQLLRDSNLSSKRTTTSSPISSYRKLLYVLSEDIPEKDLKAIKFLLSSKLQRSALEPHRSTLEVFLAMERKELLSSSDLSLLQKLLKSICPVLLKHIVKFEASQENKRDGTPTSTGTMPPTQTPTSEPVPQLPQVQSALAEYPMTNPQRGVCWIVNNFDFSSSKGHDNRDGTNVDEDSLRKVFTWLGFKVEVMRDATGEQMHSSMRELSWRDHSDMDCVACCILSHGLKGGVYGVDGEVVKLMDLNNLLSGLKCPSLKGKPKLFFIQACQGTQEQQAVSIQADGPSSPEVGTETNKPSDPGVGTQTDGPSSSGVLCADAMPARDLIPNTADYVFAMSTVPSYVSLRDPQGSWFIQALCQTLVRMVPRGEHLVDILTEVNNEVSKKGINTRIQMSQHNSALRMRVVFPIPEDPPPSLSTTSL